MGRPDCVPQILGGRGATRHRGVEYQSDQSFDRPDDLANSILTISGSSARVASRGMEKTGLSEAQIKQAEADYREERNLAADAKVNFPDRVYV